MYVTLLQDIVNAICDDDDIRAVSFVGSNTVSLLIMITTTFQFLLLYSFQIVVCSLNNPSSLVVLTFRLLCGLSLYLIL